MTLKNTRLARAENLSQSTRDKIGIQRGLVIIETHNPNLRDEYKPATSIRDYLLTLGEFKDTGNSTA